MEFPVVRLRMRAFGTVKVNVHGFFTDEPLHQIRYWVVIRDHRAIILRLYVGLLRIMDRRVNEFYVILEGLNRAYWDSKDMVELETNNFAAHWEGAGTTR